MADGGMTRTELKELKGATLTAVHGLETGSEDVVFSTTDGRTVRMYHDADCCETVEINEIEGDLADLIGHPLLEAVEISHEEEENEDGCARWTFYTFATIKGRVQVRWLGSSNGYYSTSVYLAEVK